MRLTVTAVDPREGQRADFLIEADPATPTGEIAVELGRRLGTRPADGERPALYLGTHRTPTERPVGELDLRDGGLLGLGGPLPVPPAEPEGVLELRAVGGTGAGAVFRLPAGEYTVGAGPQCAVRIAAEDLPAVAARLRIAADGTAEARAVAPDGVLLDAGPAPDWTPFPVGGVLTAGPVLLELAEPTRPDAAVQPAADGTVEYNRPPRLLPPPVDHRFRLPQPPGRAPRHPLQLALVFAPLLMSLVGVMVFNNARYLVLGLLSPVIALVGQLSHKRRGKDDHQEQLEEYERHKTRLDEDVAAAVLAEQRARRTACPDPAAVTLITTGPRQRLWERRWRDPDFLLLRLGTGDRPAHLELQDPTEPEHRQRITRITHAVPVTVPLRGAGVLGVAGGAAAVPLTRWIVAQCAALHSPADLRICVLSGNRDKTADADRWSWVHWLPHTAPLDDRLGLGTTAESTARRIAELTAVVQARTEARTEAGGRAARGGAAGEPDVLVVLDGARRLRALPGVIALLRDGPAVGVHFVCVDEEARLLPEECRAVAVASHRGLHVGQDAADPVEGALMDAPDAAWALGVARALAPVRDVGDDTEENLLPGSARLLDVLGLEPPTAGAIAAGWAAGGGRTTRAVLGEGLDGPFAVDLCADGPHALIAGTTGSGKSELLQTLVASLAVANRPDELTFVLVDYKGGSAFAECADLPHTVGMVTDLDTHLVERALVSLGAELKRREHLLAAAGAKDIEDHADRRTRDPALPPLPRLVLVIDEFASMVRELPDFVTGLVGIAQRGRSLGLHLILATQRPSGAVTADIRANTNLRIALRTTDQGESRDIIDAPDSGTLSPRTPGRAYARLGHAALLPFQTGRIGGRRRAPDRGQESEERPAPVLTEIHWETLGDPPPPPRTGEGTAVQSVTDLSVLVTAVKEAAAGLTGLKSPRRPWLPPLPDLLTLDETRLLPAPPGRPEPGALAPVAYGLIDLPDQQSRAPLTLDLDTQGHVQLIGAPRSGRSQFLRTVAAALVSAHSAADVHLYGLDCGTGALQALAALPHTGAVVDRTRTDRVARLLTRLATETGRRRTLIGREGAADLTELRRRLPAGERPAHLVLLIDRFEAFERDFASYDQGSVRETMHLLLREGPGAGVHVVVTGDRVLTQARYAATTEDKLIARLHDKGDYSMAGLAPRQIPDRLPPGRVVVAGGLRGAQIALIGPDPSGAAQAEALRTLAEEVGARDAEVPRALRPFRVDDLPEALTFEDALARRPEGTSPLWTMIGVGGDDLTAVGPDLSRVPSCLIAGPPRSGRSTVLLTGARSLLTRGTKIVVVAPRASPLRDLGDHPGVVEVFTDPGVTVADFRAALGKVDSPAGAIVVDDAELMLDSDLDGDLSAVARGTAGDGWGLLVAGDNEALDSGLPGWHTQVRRNRCGALLAPRRWSDGDLLGQRVPAGLLGTDSEPGRAHAHLGDSRWVTLRVPATTAAEALTDD
ncbi:FtsK/SpoIIIE domain-containing protein [Streptomyces sp. NPDC091377]|uniref:FtsK/SpoIIIE domain-containing protein n=1 Tax=Streptomyces sp. NPDC091377 TaxID=3365995 RepID=UPI0038215166